MKREILGMSVRGWLVLIALAPLIGWAGSEALLVGGPF